ncbi:unnamed protein product [Caenorhabditis sp. 36 PRJEB53466]|nr:unnamed protein product [Caenorhabditis sp. 36 PRJEB53466]
MEHSKFTIQRPEHAGEIDSRHGSKRSSCYSADDDDDLDVPRDINNCVSDNQNEPQTDRFGFFLVSSSLTKFQFDAKKLRRREKKWIQMLENWRYFMDEKFELVRNRCRKADGEDEEIIEKQGDDELIIDPSGGYNVFNELDGGTSEAGNKSARKTGTDGICPFVIGEKLISTSIEQMGLLNKSIWDAARGRLQFDYRTINELIENSTGETKAVLIGQSGIMKTLEIVANKWLTEMIPDNLRHNFSVSTKPQKPQVSLPSRFINPPIAVLSGAIEIHGCDREMVAITVALLFQHHLDYCFSHARHRMQKQKKDENTSA